MTDVREAMEALVAEALAAARKSLANHPELPIPPYGIMLRVEEGDGAVLMPFTFLDISQRYAILRKLVEEQRADAFMFMWAGFIETPIRQDAILFVTATRDGELHGQALPYEHSPISLRFLPVVVAPESAVVAYGQVFHPEPKETRGRR